MVEMTMAIEAVDIRKPDSGIFQLALSDIGSDPAQSCFIGDNPIADVIGSRAAGLYAIWKRGYFEWPGDRPQPEICIDALPKLVPLMQRRFRP